MTLAKPFAYWMRTNSYTNTIPPSDNDVVTRNDAFTVGDLHVRSLLHSRVTITTTTTTPPPVDWFAGIDWVQQAQWTVAPVTAISSANDGNFGDMLAAPLVLLGHYPIAAPGRDVAVWASQKVEHAKVYHAQSDADTDFPSVQAGLTLFDRHNVLSAFAGYHYEITVHQYLETLWNSTVPGP